VKRSLLTSWSYRPWVSTQTPACSVACASQLMPPKVDEVSQPLRAAKPAARSPAVP
jgi:hypothetical protein